MKKITHKATLLERIENGDKETLQKPLDSTKMLCSF
jgi:hypothetical protein